MSEYLLEEGIQRNIDESEQLQNYLLQTVTPAVSQNISENLPQFVDTFKKMWLLRQEREMELAQFMKMRESRQERFKELIKDLDGRLSKQLETISSIIANIVMTKPETELDLRDRELMLKAMGQLQQAYLHELQMIINT